MKTAILISGHMRTFDRCLPTLHWHVFRHFPVADFFVSTVAGADAPKAELLRSKYPDARVEIDVVPEQPDCIAELRFWGCDLPAEWHKGRPYTHEPYAITVRPQAIARQLWQLEQVWRLMLSRSVPEGQAMRDEYDVVIRCRPDLWFHSFAHQREVVHEWTARTPWWGSFGGVNDRFAVLGKRAAIGYFNTYSQIPKHLSAGCPFHPESLIAASLEDMTCDPSILHAEFSTLRANGELRPPEISAIDLAHASLAAA